MSLCFPRKCGPCAGLATVAVLDFENADSKTLKSMSAVDKSNGRHARLHSLIASCSSRLHADIHQSQLFDEDESS